MRNQRYYQVRFTCKGKDVEAASLLFGREYVLPQQLIQPCHAECKGWLIAIAPEWQLPWLEEKIVKFQKERGQEKQVEFNEIDPEDHVKEFMGLLEQNDRRKRKTH